MLRVGPVEKFGEMDEFSQRGGVHFIHDVGAVRFDGAFSHAKLAGDLLVELSGDDEFEDFELAVGQFIQARLALLEFFGGSAELFAVVDGVVYGGEQGFALHRLGQEIDSAGFNSADAAWNIAVTGQKNNWK